MSPRVSACLQHVSAGPALEREGRRGELGLGLRVAEGVDRVAEGGREGGEGPVLQGEVSGCRVQPTCLGWGDPRHGLLR